MYKLCSQTKSGGGNCGAAALKGKSYCYFHDPNRLLTARAAKVRYFLELPLLENRRAMQAALFEVSWAVPRGEIDSKVAGRLIYALQLASRGKQLGTPLAEQASPRRLRIAPVLGFEKIFATGRPPANPVTLAPKTAKRNFFPAARRRTTPICAKAACFQ